jgi:pescadillo
MGTFVEFYCTLLGFVNYRLYTTIGLIYPPKFDVTSDERGAELGAFTLQGRNLSNTIDNGEHQGTITNGHSGANTADVQAQVEKAAAAQQEEPREDIDGADEEIEMSEGVDKFEVTAPEGDELPQPEISGNQAAALFANITVFISREAPRHPIEFLLRAFGCKRIAWDAVLGDGAFTNNETDPRITHQVVDRPAAVEPPPTSQGEEGPNDQSLQSVKPGYIMPGRIYVQPQWIWDCINEGRLLRTDTYAPGATLPPHLSPWIKPTNGQYDPRATLEEQELEGEADEDVSEVDEVEEDEIQAIENGTSDDGASDDDGMDVASSEEELSEGAPDAFGGFDDHEEDDQAEQFPDADVLHQRELEAEVSGKPISSSKPDPEKEAKDKARRARESQKTRETEEIERRKMMMSNKKRKLYEKMQFGNEKKDAEAAKLRKKRRKMEMEQERS